VSEEKTDDHARLLFEGTHDFGRGMAGPAQQVENLAVRMGRLEAAAKQRSRADGSRSSGQELPACDRRFKNAPFKSAPHRQSPPLMSPNVRPFYGRIIKRRTLQKRIAYFHRQSPSIGLFRVDVADGQSAQQAMQD
jgi:hypothetical protein